MSEQSGNNGVLVTKCIYFGDVLHVRTGGDFCDGSSGTHSKLRTPILLSCNPDIFPLHDCSAPSCRDTTTLSGLSDLAVQIACNLLIWYWLYRKMTRISGTL